MVTRDCWCCGLTSLTATGKLQADLAPWQFGDGIGYSSFELRMVPSPKAGAGEEEEGAPTVYQVEVSNTGSAAGSDTVIVYFRLMKQHAQEEDAPALPVLPNRQCIDFGGIWLAPGAKATLSFTVADTSLRRDCASVGSRSWLIAGLI